MQKEKGSLIIKYRRLITSDYEDASFPCQHWDSIHPLPFQKKKKKHW